MQKIHSLFLKIVRKNELLKSIKGHNSVEKLGKLSYISHNTTYTKLNQNPSICSQDMKQNFNINHGPEFS